MSKILIVIENGSVVKVISNTPLNYRELHFDEIADQYTTLSETQKADFVGAEPFSNVILENDFQGHEAEAAQLLKEANF